MKNMILIVAIVAANLTVNFADAQGYKRNYVYWEQITDSLQKQILASNDISDDALKYYDGKLKISDNDRSFALLDSLSNKHINNNINALYFHLFNKICSNSDGAFAEALGKYCQKVIINDPVYVINYFSSHNSLMKTYARLLGAELYFKEEGTSQIKYNYKDFKKILYDKIGEDKNLKNTLENFYNEIDKVMKSMD